MRKRFFIIFSIFQLFMSVFAQNQKEDNFLNLNFWQKFDDDILIENIIKASNNNPDLKIAALKVKESEKIVKLSLSQELPQINFDGLLGRTLASSDLKRGDNNFMINSYRQTRFLLPLSASWEVDIWGKNRLRTKSAKESLKMFKEDERMSVILLESAVASDYFNLIKTDELLKLQKELLELTSLYCDLVKNKHKHGLATLDKVLDVEEKLVLNEAAINNLEAKKEVLQNRLNYLLGNKFFEEIKRSNFDTVKPLENIPKEVNSDIISNRPDVKSAIYNIKRADLEARAAKRELLPSFTITGTLGFNGYDNFSHIFSSNTGLADLWVNPNLNIFDGGKKHNLLKLKKIEYEEAQKEYEKAIITAIEEVNNSLAFIKSENKNYKLSYDIFNIVKKKTDLKLLNKTHGLSSEIDYILYQSAQIIAQQNLVSDKINYIISAIDLYKSTGGVDFIENL